MKKKKQQQRSSRLYPIISNKSLNTKHNKDKCSDVSKLLNVGFLITVYSYTVKQLYSTRGHRKAGEIIIY
jgi:hypothetical protein